MNFTSFLLISLLTLLSQDPATDVSEPCLSSEEKNLFESINSYRKSKKLQSIPFSARLSKVAQTHAKDLMQHYTFSPDNECNPHSWSDKGDWTSCCYTADHREAECMWNKPQEISGYAGSGYEIAYYTTATVLAEDALRGWKNSPAHHELIINKGIWEKVSWKAMGVGIAGNYAIVWFGEVADPSIIKICTNQ